MMKQLPTTYSGSKTNLRESSTASPLAIQFYCVYRIYSKQQYSEREVVNLHVVGQNGSTARATPVPRENALVVQATRVLSMCSAPDHSSLLLVANQALETCPARVGVAVHFTSQSIKQAPQQLVRMDPCRLAQPLSVCCPHRSA